MTGAASLDPSDVCVVITTYGERAELCLQVVEGALRESVGRVVVVNNGAAPGLWQHLAQLGEEIEAVAVLNQGCNRGSAAGVAAGLSWFLAMKQWRAVWILDDDTVPRSGALAELLVWHQRMAGPGGLLAFRPTRPYQAAMVAGRSAAEAYPSPSAYLNFSVMDLADRLRQRRRPQGAAVRTEPIPIPYGAYGGLLLDREAVDRIGLPREDLVLYEDDAEYTARLARANMKLHLVPSAVVDDIDGIWAEDGQGGTALGRLLTTPHATRAFYSTRNRVFFESRYWCTNALVFRVNKAVWLVLLALTALRRRRIDRLRMLVAAMRAGERGELGVDPAHPLPS